MSETKHTPVSYRVTVTHGEGASIFACVDTSMPEAEQPAIMRTFSTVNDGASARWLAEDFCRYKGVGK